MRRVVIESPYAGDVEGNATGPLVEVRGTLDKHAERIQQAKAASIDAADV
jgi:hypothetical protein